MRTIGRRWPRKAPKGDYVAMCDYCGVNWRRSKLIRDRAGYLVCPDDRGGRDAVTLAEEAAAAAQDAGDIASNYYDGGKYVGQ